MSHPDREPSQVGTGLAGEDGTGVAESGNLSRRGRRSAEPPKTPPPPGRPRESRTWTMEADCRANAAFPCGGDTGPPLATCLPRSSRTAHASAEGSTRCAPRPTLSWPHRRDRQHQRFPQHAPETLKAAWDQRTTQERDGRTSEKLAPRPEPSDAAVTSPPCARAIPRAMVSPIPDPLDRRACPAAR